MKEANRSILITFKNGQKLDVGPVTLHIKPEGLEKEFEELKSCIKNRRPYEQGDLFIPIEWEIIFVMLLNNGNKKKS